MKNLIFQKLSAAFFALVLLFSTGCSDYLDINTDPNAATEVEGDLLFPTALGYIASNRAIEIGPGNTLFSQIWSSNGSTGVFTDAETYAVSPFTTGNTWSFYYTDVLKNLELVVQQAESAEPVRNNVAAQAKILQSYVFYELTVLFGSIPYTEAVDTEISQPNFDDQETVLRGLVQDLTDAVNQIDNSSSALAGVTDGDLIYNGNMAQWQKFGNSLKLRVLMLIRNKDNSVDSEIQILLEEEPLIRSNLDEAAIPFFNAVNNENNLWKLNNQFAGFVNAANGNGYLFAGDPFVSMMKGLNDPRLDTYFEYAVDFDDENAPQQTNEYFGQEAGVFDYNDGETSMVSQNIIREDWPSRIVTAAEVYFYEAEYYANQNDLDAADDSYRAGVQAAIDYFDGKPGEISDTDRDDYINSLPDLTVTGQTAALEAIHEQEYIEVFDRAPENWTQWRRVKVPDLPVPQNALLGDIIRRFPLPPDEISSNPNVPSNRPPNDAPMWFEN